MKLALASIAVAALLAGYGCTKSETKTTVASEISSIDSLPKITGAVSGSGAQASGNSTKLVDFDDSATWSGTGKSRPMCELGSMTREILREAASPDKTLCYVGKMESLGKFASGVDDGNFHYYAITFEGQSGQPMRVRFKIVKDGNKITNYEMVTCNHNGTAYTQNEYTGVTIADGQASITSKYIGGESAGGMTMSWSSNVSVTGEVDGTGAWTSKTMEAARRYAYDGAGSNDGSFNQKLTLTQTAAHMLIDGYNSSTFYNSGKQSGPGNSTFSMRMYGKVQLLAADQMSTIAFGDGSAKAIMTFDGVDVEGGSAGTAHNAHWNGNTTETSTSDYADDVTAASPRADDGTVSVSFTTDQTWDCSGTFETATVTESDMTTLMTCDDKFGFGEGEGGGSNACYSMQ